MARSASRFFLSPKVQVGDSGQKGRGMFTRQAVRRGEVLEVAPALLVPGNEADELLTTFLAHYIFRTDKGDRYVVGLGYTSLFNHAARPNAEFFVDNVAVTIKATRAIAAGAEVTVSYGWTKREWATIGGCLD